MAKEMTMGILSWVVLGLIIGLIAWVVTSAGRQQGSITATVTIGILGAFLGGFFGNLITGTRFFGGFSLWSELLAIVGAVILLGVYARAIRPTVSTRF